MQNSTEFSNLIQAYLKSSLLKNLDNLHSQPVFNGIGSRKLTDEERERIASKIKEVFSK